MNKADIERLLESAIRKLKLEKLKDVSALGELKTALFNLQRLPTILATHQEGRQNERRA